MASCPKFPKHLSKQASGTDMTGRPGYRTMEMIGEVTRRTSLVPLAFPCFVLRLIGLETKNVLDDQGRAGDHFHCMVERSPGHIRCRKLSLPEKNGQIIPQRVD